jgi:hypothetical protein
MSPPESYYYCTLLAGFGRWKEFGLVGDILLKITSFPAQAQIPKVFIGKFGWPRKKYSPVTTGLYLCD